MHALELHPLLKKKSILRADACTVHMLLHATMYTHIVSIYTTVDDDQDDTKTDDESDFGGG